jgi:hypothetical protein
MRHEDPQLQLWLASTGIARERMSPRTWVDRHASEGPTLRQRAGQAVIAAGEWLAGGQARIADRRPLAARPS